MLGRHRRLPGAWAIILAGWIATSANAGTIGLVLGDWRFGLHETANGKEECPEGFQFKQIEQFRAQFPTEAARQAWMERYGYPANRGPNGENVFAFPAALTDPLPFRRLASKTAIGLDLDGETEGKGAGYSVPHDNFISPDGRPGIDNQLYRVIGCIQGWRSSGMIQGIVAQYTRSEYESRVIVEVTGVEDERDDPDVTVTLYRGLDPVAQDAAGKLIPWLSQRIDYAQGRRFIHALKGRITGGVLTTDPADVVLPAYENPDMLTDRRIHQMRLRLTLTPTGAEGLLGGYVDIQSWYRIFAGSWGGHTTADVQGWSGPTIYKALTDYADYRDPATGRLTGISAGYEVGFTRAYILHDDERPAAAPRKVARR